MCAQIDASGKADFTASPPCVNFNDALGGKEFTQAVVLTNVSGAPAAFKVHEGKLSGSELHEAGFVGSTGPAAIFQR